MTNIEVSLDSVGQLSLKQYKDATNRIELNLKEKAVATYLANLSSSHKMRKVQLDMQSGEIQNILVEYDQFLVGLINCQKLEKKEALLRPYFTKIEQKLEHQKLEQMKRSNREKGRESSKVTRKNKHTKGKIAAGVVAFSILVGGLISMSDTKSEASSVEDETIKTIEEIDEIGLENPTFENLDFKENFNAEMMPVVENLSSNVPTIVTPLNYEDRSQTPKAINTKEMYGDIIEHYAIQYGVDPNLVLAIATQESGVHTSEKNEGGATGLMQIQNGVWEDKQIQAYNYETNQVDSFTIRKEMLSDVYKNIQIGCMYFQNCMQSMNNNTLAAIQCYNMGPGSMGKILDAYAKDNGTTKEAVLNNPTDLGWLAYRGVVSKDGREYGDKEYVEHVLSWVEDSASVFSNARNVDFISIKNGESSGGIKVH